MLPEACVVGRGLRKMRHVQVCYVWLEVVVEEKQAAVEQIP